MRIAINKMCRGQGVAYMLATLSDCSCADFDFTAFSETGTRLPLEAYSIDVKGSRKAYVLATPLLDTVSVVVRVTAVDGKGKELGTAEKRISRARIKWSSKLFYALDSEQANRLRDIDRFTYSNQIHIKPMFYTLARGKGELVTKGVICGPRGADDVSLVLLAHDGSVVDSFVPYLTKGNVVSYEGVPRVEVPFTARIPDDGNTYCLVARGPEGCRSGFMCFDKASRDYYLSKYRPPFYLPLDCDRWSSAYKEQERQFELADPADYTVADGPQFSIVVPLYNTPVSFFNEMVRSVLDQLYQNWELILVNSTPGNAELTQALGGLTDSRIRVITLEKNLGIAVNTMAGVREAKGDFVVFFDHDDVLDKLVLFRYASWIKKHPETDALYCDEDFLTEDGNHVSPHFKSDFNLDLLRCHNYITHLLAARRDLTQEIGLRSEFDGAQDYDFVLRLSERTHNIAHIREVLYHWRMSDTSTAKSAGNKNYASEAGLKALRGHLERMGCSATAEFSESSCFYKTRYQVTGNPKVSILIPNKDCTEMLDRCLSSIQQKTEYKNYEVIVIENNSEDPATFEYYKKAEATYKNLKVVYWPGEFNYSKINNFGASFASGEYFLLLNNDTEVIAADWLSSMVGFCQREEVGVVGARLLYPDDTVQHAGIVMLHCRHHLGEMGGPAHVFSHLDSSDPGYMNRAVFSQDVTCVTGACLMTKRSVYEELGGLSESYAVAYNDVDFCLRVLARGELVVYDADAALYHYESFSRGSDERGAAARRFITEQGRLRMEWPDCFLTGDRYHTRF